MLVVLAERLAQILEWLKKVAGYRIVESKWKALDVSGDPLDKPLISANALLFDQSAVMDYFPHLNEWIASNDQVKFLWMTNLSGSSKEDLRQSLMASQGQDVFLLGISYSNESQSLTCRRSTPNNSISNRTLPRCKSYRLRQSLQGEDLLTSPRDTLSAVARRTGGCSRTIYFSRHGESQYNVLGKVGGDAELSPRGQQYASRLADYVNGTLMNTTGNGGLRLWTSCLKRTIQTAAGVEAPQERLAALNELDSGVCEGMTYEEIAQRFPVEFAARDHDKLRYRYPGGESYQDLLLRVQPVLHRMEAQPPGQELLIIAHQAVLRCLLGSLLGREDKDLPYINAPLHTIMKVSVPGTADALPRLELFPLSIECVDTHRAKPQNCSGNRSAEEALVTVPAHF